MTQVTGTGGLCCLEKDANVTDLFCLLAYIFVAFGFPTHPSTDYLGCGVHWDVPNGIFIQAQTLVQLTPSLFTPGARAAQLIAQCGNTSRLLGRQSKQLIVNVSSFFRGRKFNGFV